jgi:hypothetical protein
LNKTVRVRVALVGLGPIGIEVGKALAGRRSLELIGAADPAPDKAGHPVGELLGTGGGPAVDASAAALYARTAKDRTRSMSSCSARDHASRA